MGIAVKKNTSYAVMVESVEGVYVPPAASTDFVQTLVTGSDIAPSKQVITRNIFTSSIGETSPLVGESNVTATLPVEARANSVEGAAPEYGELLQSALGAKHTIATPTTSKATGNTSTKLQLQDADVGKYAVGDIVMVKMAGAFHVSPISAVDTTASAANITLLVAHPAGVMSASAIISKSTTYIVADSGHPSLSISKYIEGTILEQAVGCKVSSVALETFSTGQLPAFKFVLDGLNFDRSETAIPHVPTYDTALPPIVLDGRAYMDGATFELNDLTFQLQNTLAFETSINAPNGRVASRATARTISGTINPYKQSDNIDNFTRYQLNTPFSLFAYAKVPTGVTGEFHQVVAVYMPNCVITQLAEADQNGLLQETITYSANRGSTGSIPEIYIALI